MEERVNHDHDVSGYEQRNTRGNVLGFEFWAARRQVPRPDNLERHYSSLSENHE